MWDFKMHDKFSKFNKFIIYIMFFMYVDYRKLRSLSKNDLELTVRVWKGSKEFL